MTAKPGPIVVFSHAHPSISKGGAEVSAYTLYLGLLRMGRSAAFVATCHEADMAKLRFDTPHEYGVPFQPAAYDHFFHHAEPALFDAMHDIVSRLRPSALVFHHFLYLGINTVRRLSASFSVPSALVLHEFLAICHHHGQMVTHPQKKLCHRAGAALCASCFPEHPSDEFNVRKVSLLNVLASLSVLISPSHFLARRFIDWGIGEDKLVVIENGLAGHGTTAPHAAAESAGADAVGRTAAPRAGDTSPMVVGYFGQINPFKGIDQILDAMDHIQRDPQHQGAITIRVHGNVVGVTEEFRTRFAKASEAGGSIEYFGPYQNTDVINLMQACDYIVMASKWWENSPVVIQEAFAAKRPIIAPNIGGMAEKIIDRVSGRHFVQNDPQDLARILLVCEREYRAGRNNYEFPETISAIDMARSYIDALQLSPNQY